MIKLKAEQILFFESNGFLVMGPITTDEELSRLRTIYDRLFEMQAGRENGDQFDLAGTDEEGKPAGLPQILTPSKYAPELLKGNYFDNAMSIAKQLLGPQARFTGEHAILKPAHTGSPTPWHQDEAYWSPEFDYHALSLWMPLQQATLENGCMEFIPGSHKRDILPHQSIGNDPRIHGLELAIDIDTGGKVSCPLPAGGATLHLSRTLHYTGPNRSQEPRRALILNFGTPPVKRTKPRDFYWQIGKRTARMERASRD